MEGKLNEGERMMAWRDRTHGLQSPISVSPTKETSALFGQFYSQSLNVHFISVDRSLIPLIKLDWNRFWTAHCARKWDDEAEDNRAEDLAKFRNLPWLFQKDRPQWSVTRSKNLFSNWQKRNCISRKKDHLGLLHFHAFPFPFLTNKNCSVCLLFSFSSLQMQ